ncbi:unnamed protein product [Pedinophyceae sp. YPF-701]|nr:unnamed protein product [Pedinophyceae sp. YPF-701]
MEVAQQKLHDVLQTPSAKYWFGPQRNFVDGEDPYMDPRVKDWPLIQGWIPFGLTVAYIVGVPLGMLLMKNREPFKIKHFAMLHNLVLFSLSVWMWLETSYAVWEMHASKGQILCLHVEDPARDFSPMGQRLATVLYIHYLSKAYEFFDTVIMILKKNFRQVTFLHVYHHSLTFYPLWWITVRYAPGGEAWMVCALNSFIHVLMYSYYLLAGLGYKPPYKQLVTRSQMFQFVLVVAQGTYTYATGCARPRFVSVEMVAHGGILLLLFANFYVMTYLKRGAKKQKAQ